MLLHTTLVTSVLSSLAMTGLGSIQTSTLPASTVTVNSRAHTVTETKTASTLTVVARTVTKTLPASTVFVTHTFSLLTRTVTEVARSTTTQGFPSKTVTATVTFTQSQPVSIVTPTRECHQSFQRMRTLTVTERITERITCQRMLPTATQNPWPIWTPNTGLGDDNDETRELNGFYELIGNITGLSADFLHDAAEQISTIIDTSVGKHPVAMLEALGEAAKSWVGEAEDIAGGLLKGLPDLLLGYPENET